ncbi:MAG TPA: hypothetical protein PLM79_13095 [Syntrophobacteraceae bacterium]|nr:hypothetical protein [Syntrophobacteraceae bacterium]
MRARPVRPFLYCLGVVLVLHWMADVHGVHAGALRITMQDGTSLEVPYYWEEGGEIKFEIAGGVAGLPKGQVASVQEILSAREFDPEVLLQPPIPAAEVNEKQVLQELLEAKLPSSGTGQKVDPEEGTRLLRQAGAVRESRPAGERIYGPTINLEGDFIELVKSENEGLMLEMRKVISSRTELKSQQLVLVLYDGEGSVLQRKTCRVQPLDLDLQTRQKLDLRGKLYLVTATLKPDQRIKRYEITAAQP